MGRTVGPLGLALLLVGQIGVGQIGLAHADDTRIVKVQDYWKRIPDRRVNNTFYWEHLEPRTNIVIAGKDLGGLGTDRRSREARVAQDREVDADPSEIELPGEAWGGKQPQAAHHTVEGAAIRRNRSAARARVSSVLQKANRARSRARARSFGR
jgi:hypothetical protein